MPTDYVAAAHALLNKGTQAASEQDPEVVAAASGATSGTVNESGNTEVDPDVAAALASGEKQAPPPPPRPAPVAAPSISATAREKAELRKQQKVLAEREAALRELEEAKKSGSALALLKAAGKSYADVTREAIGIQKKPVESNEDPTLAEVRALREELAAVRKAEQERAQMSQAQAAEKQFKDFAVEVAKKHAAKLPHVTALEATDKAVDFLRKWVQEYGEPPSPGNDEESFLIALEAVEAEEAEAAKQWEERLTKLRTRGKVVGTPPASGAPKPAVDEAKSHQAEQHDTLTNSWAAPSPVAARRPKTREDYEAAALALINRPSR
jgi:hypothetical protein